MTPTVIIVMLIWAGAPPASTPATITGFRTIGDCERAIPTVTDVYNKSPVNAEAVAKCISLEAGESRGMVKLAGHPGRHDRHN
jgi:hypothetical protein